MSGYQNISIEILKVLETFSAALQGKGKEGKDSLPSGPVMLFRNISLESILQVWASGHTFVSVHCYS